MIDRKLNYNKLQSEYHQLYIKYKTLQQKLSIYENNKIINIESSLSVFIAILKI